MQSNQVEHDPRYQLLVDLLHEAGTIAEHETMCGALWRNVYDRGWILLACARRVCSPDHEQDEACEEFLGKILIEVVGESPEATDLLRRELSGRLGALIMLLPDDAWNDPRHFWQALVREVCDEFSLPEPSVDIEFDCKVDGIAILIRDAIDDPLAPDVQRRLSQLLESGEYPWLKAVEDVGVMAVHESLLHDRAQASSPFLDEQVFAQAIAATDQSRRRFLYVMNETSSQRIWGEVKINSIQTAIAWMFEIPCRTYQTVQLVLYADDNMVGRLDVSRSSADELEIQEARGILIPIWSRFPSRIPLVRAAAGQQQYEWIKMSKHLVGSFQLDPVSLNLTIEWSKPEP